MSFEDRRVFALAQDLLSGSIDRVDGLQEIGRLVVTSSVWNPATLGVLVAVSDDLDVVPALSQRGLWNPTAFDEARAQGESVVDWYWGDVLAALESLVVSLGRSAPVQHADQADSAPSEVDSG